jgi:hypothetical protein
VAPSPASAPARFKPAAQPERRTVKSAKFVTAGEAATHMKLGADGQLPQLHLREGEQHETKVEEKQGVNPLILVALLVSVAASVAILFIPEETQSESRSKATARDAIRKHYTETLTPIDPKLANKPYQYYLGQALQAHSRGDYPTELRNYRHVMNLLHSEGISKVVGLTGRIGTIDDPPVPSDRHLEQQLTILLSD